MSSDTLTPHQKLRAATAVLCDGVDQHVVASLLGVNPGRVNEATQAVRKALDFPMRPKIIVEVPPEEAS